MGPAKKSNSNQCQVGRVERFQTSPTSFAVIIRVYEPSLLALRRAKRSAWGREADEGWRRAKETLDTVNRSVNFLPNKLSDS